MNHIMRCLIEDRPRGPWSAAERAELVAHVTQIVEMTAQPVLAPEPPPPEERWLTPEDVTAKYPAITRRWLFKNGERLGFAKLVGRKLQIGEQALARWLARKR
jgi:hypothetical protein